MYRRMWYLLWLFCENRILSGLASLSFVYMGVGDDFEDPFAQKAMNNSRNRWTLCARIPIVGQKLQNVAIPGFVAVWEWADSWSHRKSWRIWWVTTADFVQSKISSIGTQEREYLWRCYESSRSITLIVNFNIKSELLYVFNCQDCILVYILLFTCSPVRLLSKMMNHLTSISLWGVVLHIGIGLHPIPICKTTTWLEGHGERWFTQTAFICLESNTLSEYCQVSSRLTTIAFECFLGNQCRFCAS